MLPLEDLALDCRPLAELGLEWIFNTWGSDENFVLFLIEDALLGRLLSLDDVFWMALYQLVLAIEVHRIHPQVVREHRGGQFWPGELRGASGARIF